MKYRYISFLFILTIAVLPARAQLGGRYAFTFLDQPVSARLAALGTNQASIADKDINVAFVNPSFITADINNQLAFNYVNFFAGSNFGAFNYAHTFNKVGSFMGSIQFMDYGKFDYADEAGNTAGTFGASDFSFNIGWGRQLDSLFSIGANLKILNSFYESYNSFGIAVDVAGTYKSKTGWTMSIIASNIGFQISTFSPGEQRAPLPFNLQYALSKRLEHVPFRFSFVYNHIEKWDLTYFDPANPPGGIDPITGEPQEQKGLAKFGDQFMRHIVLGAEIYIGKNIVLRGGYNYRRRKELSIVDKPGMVGFSWGLGVRIYKFKINYSRSTYHLIGSPNYISLVFDLDTFKNDETVRF